MGDTHASLCSAQRPENWLLPFNYMDPAFGGRWSALSQCFALPGPLPTSHSCQISDIHSQNTGRKDWCECIGQVDCILPFISSTLLLLLPSRFSRVRLCATPSMAAHQAPPSLGFSRQEHWSGLPLPSLVHESEKWKGSTSVVSDSLWPHGLQSTRLLRPWDFPGKGTGVGCHCLLHQSTLMNP